MQGQSGSKRGVASEPAPCRIRGRGSILAALVAFILIQTGCQVAETQPSQRTSREIVDLATGVDGIANDVAVDVTVTSVDGVSIKNPDISRIITLGGTVTEIVYALGHGHNIVGVDLSSRYPAEVMEKPRLSYFRQASVEGILSLDPSIVIAPEGMGPPAVLEQLRSAGVPILLLPDAQNLEDAEERLRTVGSALGAVAVADSILVNSKTTLKQIGTDAIGSTPRALFVYARGAGLVNVSGSDTAAELVMDLAGATNTLTSFDGFKPITAEAVVEAAPDVIIIPQKGLESIGGIEGLLKQPGIAQTPAGENRRIVSIDDSILLGLGPRMADGVAELTAELVALFGNAPAQPAS